MWAQNSIKLLQDELRTLDKRLAEARQDYERVIVAEGDRIKALQKAEQAARDLRLQCDAAKSKAIASEGALASAEESWRLIKDRLEQDIESQKKRSDDLSEQNKILHSQFEIMNERLRTMHGVQAAPADSAEASPDNLGEVIRYLRREKEILEKEHELALQKTVRLQLQVDHLQRSLDETRLALNDVGVFVRLRSSFDEAQEALRSAETELAASKAAIASNEASNQSLELQYKEERKKLIDRSNDIGKKQQSRIMSLTTQIDGLRLEKSSKEEQVQQLQAELQTLLNQWNSAKSRIQSLEEQNSNALLQIKGLEAQIKLGSEASRPPPVSATTAPPQPQAVVRQLISESAPAPIEAGPPIRSEMVVEPARAVDEVGGRDITIPFPSPSSKRPRDDEQPKDQGSLPPAVEAGEIGNEQRQSPMSEPVMKRPKTDLPPPPPKPNVLVTAPVLSVSGAVRSPLPAAPLQATRAPPASIQPSPRQVPIVGEPTPQFTQPVSAPPLIQTAPAATQPPASELPASSAAAGLPKPPALGGTSSPAPSAPGDDAAAAELALNLLRRKKAALEQGASSDTAPKQGTAASGTPATPSGISPQPSTSAVATPSPAQPSLVISSLAPGVIIQTDDVPSPANPQQKRRIVRTQPPPVGVLNPADATTPPAVALGAPAVRPPPGTGLQPQFAVLTTAAVGTPHTPTPNRGPAATSPAISSAERPVIKTREERIELHRQQQLQQQQQQSPHHLAQGIRPISPAAPTPQGVNAGSPQQQQQQQQGVRLIRPVLRLPQTPQQQQQPLITQQQQVGSTPPPHPAGISPQQHVVSHSPAGAQQQQQQQRQPGIANRGRGGIVMRGSPAVSRGAIRGSPGGTIARGGGVGMARGVRPGIVGVGAAQQSPSAPAVAAVSSSASPQPPSAGMPASRALQHPPPSLSQTPQQQQQLRRQLQQQQQQQASPLQQSRGAPPSQS
ncbi:hypothetical protein HK405_014080 [Cladochytrium tenue]|nr:hypothetical protein HK405_014080 [Cladochytrium tenue]